MSNILRKYKKKKEENKILTNEELESYTNRIYELKDLMVNALNNRDYSNLEKYANEIKSIKKILKNAEKVAKKNGK